MKIAFVTTDNRWIYRKYYEDVPSFGMAPDALLTGFAALPKEIKVHVISCVRQPVKSPQKLADNIWFHSLHVPKIGWMRTLYYGCSRAVQRKIREINPDLVHGQGTEHENSISAVRSGYPNVVTLLGIMKEMAQIMKARPGSFYWLAAKLEDSTLRRTTGVLANSKFTQAKVRGRTPKTWLVPNAVREIFFQTPLTITKPNPPILLNVGLVCANKRQNELLDITDALQAEGLNFRLQFLGQASVDSPYAARFLARIKKSSYASHHGFKQVEEVLKSYDQASALVHVSEIESFGLVVAEALARNLKFIGFNTGGVADIIEKVEGAEGFADEDWLGVRNALRQWVQVGGPRPLKAADMMHVRYSPAAIARQHLEIYRGVLVKK